MTALLQAGLTRSMMKMISTRLRSFLPGFHLEKVRNLLALYGIIAFYGNPELRKLIALDGKLRRSEWTKPETGEKRFSYYIEAKNVYFAEGKKSEPENAAAEEAPEDYRFHFLTSFAVYLSCKMRPCF